MRMQHLAACALSAAVFVSPVRARAAGAPAATAPSAPAATGKDKADVAIDHAVRFLISQQDAQEGWIDDKSTTRTAMTSLAVLAMAAAGNQPTDATPQGRAMTRAIRYVLDPDRQDDSGYFGKDGSQMYGHGITTLMLAEMLGMGTDDQMDQLIRRRLTKAVELILRAQQVPKPDSAKGGWRYQPDTSQSDLSVTVWQLLALRSAKNAGIKVPSSAIDDAVQYVKSCYMAVTDAAGAPVGEPTGFGYTAGSGKYMSTSTTAMGLLAMQLCGAYASPVCRGAGDYLADHPPAWGNVWLFYGSYYYAQALYQRGGREAVKAQQVVAALLLPEQHDDGSWESSREKEREAGQVFSTSMGILALAVKCHYLPIYQR